MADAAPARAPDDDDDVEELVILFLGLKFLGKKKRSTSSHRLKMTVLRSLDPIHVRRAGSFRLHDDLTRAVAPSFFRLTVDEISALASVMVEGGFPRIIFTSVRDRCSLEEAICIVLAMLATPTKLEILGIACFGRSASALSRIFTETTTMMLEHYGWLLSKMDTQRIARRLAEYDDCVQRAGCPLRHIVGFVDGTFRPVCRPSVSQREFYTGKERTHGINFLGVIFPDGIIAHLHGPVLGSQHDAQTFAQSPLSNLVAEMFFDEDGDPKFFLYGDSAFPATRYEFLKKPLSGLFPDEVDINTRMSRFV